MRRFLNISLIVLACLTLVLGAIITSCGFWLGAIFRLRDDSPLPSWVVLPSGVCRDQVSVTIKVYEATTTPKWKVRFVVRNKRRWFFQKIQEEIGYGYWHPDSEREKAPAGTFPNWVIIEVKGTKEVYEQSEFNDLLKIVKKPLN